MSLIGLQVEIPAGQLHVSCRSGENSVGLGPANAVSLQDPCPAEEKVFAITALMTCILLKFFINELPNLRTDRSSQISQLMSYK